VRVPERFDLDLVVRSHGWYDLPPWRYERDRGVLSRPLRLGSGRAVLAEVAPGGRPGSLALRVHATGRVGAAEAAELRAQLSHALALDQDLAPFHARAAAIAAATPPPAAGRGRGGPPDLAWAVARGAGRLLRSPTVYEDAVKTLCTTNCSWALTRAMVGKLVAELGDPSPGGGRAFPTAAAMAARPERFYRDVVRAGYRARALRALAGAAASGALDLEGWRDPARPIDDLAAAIRSLDGFGPYATGHLLKLLGRFDHLALDSWSRAKLARLRGFRRVPSDRTIERWYAPFGEWAGLAMWLEVTADWHGDAPSWP
jgi:N-glycosylase/DNA lyase